jgi:ABC-type phosphate/phosphonate transport system substrate-binding protein
MFALRICLFWLMLSISLTVTSSSNPSPISVGGSLESLPGSSVTDAEIAFKLVFNEMLSETNETFTVKIYENNETLVQKLQSGEVQTIFINSLQYLQLNKLLHPTARYVVQHGPSLKQRYLVLVRSSDEGKSLSDLQGRKLSFGAGHLVGKRFLDVKLLEQGLPVSKDFFSEIEMVREVNTSVIDLFFGNADVALVPDFSYELALELNPTMGNSLSVIMESEPMIYQAVGMRYDFPQERLDRIEPKILSKEYSARVRRFLETFRITHLYRLNDDMLKEVRELNDKYMALTGHKP